MTATPIPRPVQVLLLTPSVSRRISGDTIGPDVSAPFGSRHVADHRAERLDHAADEPEQTVQQAVRPDNRVGRYRQHEVLVGELAQVGAVHERGQRIGSGMLGEDLIAVGGQAALELRPLAGRTRMITRCALRRGAIDERPKVRIEPGAVLDWTLTRAADRLSGRGEDGGHHHQAEN